MFHKELSKLASEAGLNSPSCSQSLKPIVEEAKVAQKSKRVPPMSKCYDEGQQRGRRRTTSGSSNGYRKPPTGRRRKSSTAMNTEAQKAAMIKTMVRSSHSSGKYNLRGSISSPAVKENENSSSCSSSEDHQTIPKSKPIKTTTTTTTTSQAAVKFEPAENGKHEMLEMDDDESFHKQPISIATLLANY